MKAKILLITIIFLGFTQVNAQDKKLNFGLKVAPALSWLNSDEKGVSSDGAVAGFNWGFIGVYNFSQNFALVSGFNVNSLGGKLKFDATNSSAKINYSELQIPLVFQMKSSEIGKIKVYLQIGLAEGVFLSAKDGDGNSIYSQTIPVNTAWIVASGVDFPLKGGISLLGQIKYNGGITNVNKSGYNDATSSFVELGIGILF